MNVTEDELNRLKSLLAGREGASPAVRYEAVREIFEAVPKLVATVERLREAIWPGLPKWVPTEAAPQQDFHEALIESYRLLAGEAEQYRQVVQDGKRLPLPEFSQDPAFCAFVLGKLEENCKKLLAFKTYVHERLDQAGVTADPESPHKVNGCRIGGRLDELIGERDRLRESLELIANGGPTEEPVEHELTHNHDDSRLYAANHMHWFLANIARKALAKPGTGTQPAVVTEADKLREAIRDAGFAVMQTSDKWSIHDVSEKAKQHEADDLVRVRRLVDLEIERDRLREEHKRLRELASKSYAVACDAQELLMHREKLNPDFSPLCDLKELEKCAAQVLAAIKPAT